MPLVYGQSRKIHATNYILMYGITVARDDRQRGVNNIKRFGVFGSAIPVRHANYDACSPVAVPQF